MYFLRQVYDPIDGALFRDQDPLGFQGLELGGTGAGFLQEFRLPHFSFCLLQVQECEQQFHLTFRLSAPAVEQGRQPILCMVVGMQPDECVTLGDVPLFEGFPRMADLLFDESLYHRQHMGDVQDRLHLFQFQFLAQEEAFRYQVFVVIQLREIVSVFFVEDQGGLAVEFEMGGQCRCHHLSFAAEIIGSHPLPELQLGIEHHRLCIKYIQDGLGFEGRRLFREDRFHDAGIALFGAKGHLYADAGYHHGEHLLRDGVGECPGDSQRYDDLGVHPRLCVFSFRDHGRFHDIIHTLPQAFHIIQGESFDRDWLQEHRP